ncbi:cupredoxin family protein [Acidovorax sp. HDW3]|uniref:cupredoxin domain-containing protein n=1 Tax=Acidovorax sp. HDW3 TaxID=2714923 RepID=UPI001408FD7A|nr:cupredoxin family protein [Acidovorax sp. HDW3]QIL44162.1 cupredoxin family protein [Acidovorax sp. HDW3]
MNTIKLIAASALLASATAVFAHESAHAHSAHLAATDSAAPAQQTPFGIAGQAHNVQRTLTLDMSDAMRFAPAHIQVRQGQTLRLRVRNQGQVLHEIVLGTPASLAKHAQAMQAQPEMAHDSAYMAHVAPNAQGELLWQFNRAGTFEYACLIPGHFEAGMRGTITVTP